MKPLTQQVILVTGSTDGLGKQTALALAREGVTVLLHDRDQLRLEMTRQEIQEATGNARLETYLADFAELAAVRQMTETLQARHPRLDMLINNAGIGAGKQGEVRRELSKDGKESPSPSIACIPRHL
jgi:NAD(P)-dependent dehydrogenase (short-subunit alcohol dehydrogenase family)